MLGGDNLDLALAHHVERRLKGDGKLEPRQWDVLVRASRQVKQEAPVGYRWCESTNSSSAMPSRRFRSVTPDSRLSSSMAC